MSEIEKLHEKISKMSLRELCILCSNAIDMDMDKKRLDLLLHYLEIALHKERYLKKLEMKNE